MANLLSLVEYSDSESSDDKQALSIGQKRKQLSSISIMEPPTKKQKLFEPKTDIIDNKKTKHNEKNNNESSDDDDNNDDDIIQNKKKKKIKLKRLSKPAALLLTNKNKNIEFLTSQSNDDKLKKMETKMFNKHNTKQIEKQQKEKDKLELAKQNIVIKEQQNKIRNKLSELSSSLNNHNNPNSKTVKEKEKAKRMKGQSSHHSWKSETFMLLRQQFD